MPDIKIVKTNNIEKVKQEKNQLIFCKDGSIYFDYSVKTITVNVSTAAWTLVTSSTAKRSYVHTCVLKQGGVGSTNTDAGIFQIINTKESEVDIEDYSNWVPITPLNLS